MKNKQSTQRGFTQNIVICPPCGESVAGATKEGQNWKKALWPLLPRLTAVLPPQGREITARGFTLIELLVVVLIIGILAAVAVPQYQKAVDKAEFSKMLALDDAILKAQRIYFLANNEYATSFEQLDIQIPPEGNCEINSGNITTLCYMYKNEKLFAALQTYLKTGNSICCSYPTTSYKADTLCANAMETNVTNWSNGCGKSGCHCFWNNASR